MNLLKCRIDSGRNSERTGGVVRATGWWKGSGYCDVRGEVSVVTERHRIVVLVSYILMIAIHTVLLH